MGQKSIHEFKFTSIDGTEVSFSDFLGKKILIVNTASKCGFTPQYVDLEELHEQYKDDLVIVGFPANNFGGQEPGSNEEIASFCKKNYGVSFLMAEKVSVKGSDIHPIFAWLNEQENPSFKGDINWNFEKYLLDGSGQLIDRFRSVTKPNSKKLAAYLIK
jgi:glutathione peroxidase